MAKKKKTEVKSDVSATAEQIDRALEKKTKEASEKKLRKGRYKSVKIADEKTRKKALKKLAAIPFAYSSIPFAAY